MGKSRYISQNTARALAVVSGGLCYFDGCTEEKIVDGKFLGEWIHIESNQGPNSPSFNSN